MPMQLYLYNYENADNIEEVLSWRPTEKQWWITGFNPEYVGTVNVKKEVMICSVDFSGNMEMYKMLRDTADAANLEYYNKAAQSYLTFDNDNYIVWICWYEEI